MIGRQQTIKGQLITTFAIFTAAILTIAVVSYFNINRANKASNQDEAFDQIKISFLELTNLDRDFFDYGSMNSNFFRDKESSLLTKRDRLYHQLLQDIEMLETDLDQSGNTELLEKLRFAKEHLIKYSNLMANISEKIYQRGFRDTGLEGQMREHAHILENINSVPQKELLQMRRHEKDYFMRNDTMYVELFNKLNDQTRENLKGDIKAESSLLNYRNLFNQIVGLEYEIGFNDEMGMKKELNTIKAIVNSQLDELFNISNEQLEIINQKARVYILITVVFSIICATLLSIMVSNRIARPLERLSSAMDSYRANENYSFNKTNTGISEINNLQDSFQKLMTTTRSQLKEIKDTNTELYKVNNELDLFVYSTAHDLKAPLSSILGLIEVMRMENPKKSQRQYLDMMEASIHKLNDFIKDVVDYAKNNRLEVDKEKINFNELIDEILNNYKYLDNYPFIDFRVKVDNKSHVFSDYKRLHIIFRNLISNSINYADTSKGEPFVAIEIKTSNNNFEIVVSDNGKGIEEDHFEKLFGMFYRGTSDSKGSGLGLFIVNETLQKMGGKISFISKVWKGTTFNVTLPNHLESTELSESRIIKNHYQIQN